jgi:ribose 5-phosphate isomerase B
MTVFIASDHRGFELKNKILEYLHEKDVRTEDLGNYQYEPLDDYPDYARKVAQAVLQNPKEYLGIVICGSGVGVSIMVNRFTGIRCAIGFSLEQVEHARSNDHINVLAIPSDYVNSEKAETLIDTFLSAQPKPDAKYLNRIAKLDDIPLSHQA